jgi:hypothetical protein
MRKIIGLFAIMAAALPSVASAEPLVSVWRLQSLSSDGNKSVKMGDIVTEQKFVPDRLVVVKPASSWAANKTLPENSYLFKVFQSDGKSAYCTFKDFSFNNVAKSLFLPVLDRRPCFIDNDLDGRFESVFTVFDKYGSWITPSGDISSAKPLPEPIVFENVDSSLTPKSYFLRMILSGSRKPGKTTLAGFYSMNEQLGTPVFLEVNRKEGFAAAMNVEVAIHSFSDKLANITVKTSPETLLFGSSGGSIYTGPDSFLPQNWRL